MENDVITGEGGAEILNTETGAAEGAETGNGGEEIVSTTPPQIKLTYEQKLAAATTPEEKFAIADAEANKNRRLLNKERNPKPTAPANVPSKAPSQATVEETVLLAQGMPEELLTQLKKVAMVNGTGLLKAQADPIFVAVKDKFEKDKRQKDASLGASRGAGSVTASKTVSTPGLSREEHQRLAREALGE